MDALTDSAENNTLLKQDTIFAQLNFCLQNGSFRIIKSSSQAGVPGTDADDIFYDFF